MKHISRVNYNACKIMYNCKENALCIYLDNSRLAFTSLTDFLYALVSCKNWSDRIVSQMILYCRRINRLREKLGEEKAFQVYRDSLRAVLSPNGNDYCIRYEKYGHAYVINDGTETIGVNSFKDDLVYLVRLYHFYNILCDAQNIEKYHFPEEVYQYLLSDVNDNDTLVGNYGDCMERYYCTLPILGLAGENYQEILDFLKTDSDKDQICYGNTLFFTGEQLRVLYKYMIRLVEYLTSKFAAQLEYKILNNNNMKVDASRNVYISNADYFHFRVLASMDKEHPDKKVEYRLVDSLETDLALANKLGYKIWKYYGYNSGQYFVVICDEYITVLSNNQIVVERIK